MSDLLAVFSDAPELGVNGHGTLSDFIASVVTS